jgi:hypothetical protein
VRASDFLSWYLAALTRPSTHQHLHGQTYNLEAVCSRKRDCASKIRYLPRNFTDCIVPSNTVRMPICLRSDMDSSLHLQVRQHGYDRASAAPFQLVQKLYDGYRPAMCRLPGTAHTHRRSLQQCRRVLAEASALQYLGTLLEGQGTFPCLELSRVLRESPEANTGWKSNVVLHAAQKNERTRDSAQAYLS